MNFSKITSLRSIINPTVSQRINIARSSPLIWNRSITVSQRINIVRPSPLIWSRSIFSTFPPNAAPTVYEADKDYYALKVTIDDIRAKYGLGGGSRIKDANLEQNSDLELEVDLTMADLKRLSKVQKLLEEASQDLSSLISGNFEGAKDDDVVIKANMKKSVWLAEDDDVSGHAENAIKAFKENKVVGDVNAYDLDDGKIERNPVGFRGDLYS